MFSGLMAISLGIHVPENKYWPPKPYSKNVLRYLRVLVAASSSDTVVRTIICHLTGSSGAST